MYINRNTYSILCNCRPNIRIFVGMFVDWMNKRLPDYKKVFYIQKKLYQNIYPN